MNDAPKSSDSRLVAFERLLRVVDRLRAPDGCPWDRKQTLGSMAPHLLEAAYEVVDVKSNGDVGIVVIETGERLDYARAEYLADPVAETVP